MEERLNLEPVPRCPIAVKSAFTPMTRQSEYGVLPDYSSSIARMENGDFDCSADCIGEPIKQRTAIQVFGHRIPLFNVQICPRVIMAQEALQSQKQITENF
jgi:hypothetical protein